MIEPAADYERTLLLRAAAADAAAAHELLDLAGPTVYGFVYARVGGIQEVAEDLTQATFLDAMRSAQSFRGEAAIGTWLCAIARGHVARHFQAERRRARLERDLRLVAAEAETDDEDLDEVYADRETMIAALGRLTPLHRQVLVLKYLDGLSVGRMAEELGRTRIQVQSLLQRARAAMKREMEEHVDD